VVADPENHIPEILEDNNILSFDLAVPAADIAITGLGPSWPNATDGEVASVTCAMANIGSGGTRRDLAITLYVDGELVRTAVQSGLPAGHNNSVVLSFPAYPGTHRLKAQVNSGVSVLETSVLNNAAFSRLDVQKPNMIVTAIDAATEADEGAPVTVTATIANNGGGTTRDIQVAFLIDAIQLARVSVSSLLEGRSITVSAVWTARPGIHLLTVMADTGGLAGESDETDNWFSVRGIDVASADIAVLELGIEGPPVSGADRLVWARIQNAGSATSEEMDICFSLDEVQRRTVKLGGMPANSSYIVSQLIPLGTGIHTLKVTADALDSVQELDETNNDAVIDIGSLEAPELALAALRVPDTAIDGEEVQVFAEVENAGLASFSDRFDVAIFVDGLLVADVPVDGMVAGGSTTVSARWTASPGTHIFRAIVDRQNSVAEDKETDNELHRQGAAVEQPDLIARDVFAYKSLGQEATDTFTVYATIDNIGGATLRPIHIEVLADSSLLGRTELFGLPARTATQVSLPVRSLNPQRLTVVVDFDGSIREHDEFDNEASADFKPVQATAGTRPDLTVVDISIPMAELTDGQPTVVYVTIDNTGNATLAGGVEVGLCCTDGSMFKTALNGLLPGGSAVIGFPWTASGWTGTDGNITFNATVNFGRTMPEWSFDDNELLRTFLVHLPDLRISSLWRWNTTEGLKAPMFAMVDNLGIGDTVRPTTLDVFIGGQLHSQHGLNGLRAGERLTVPIGWTAISGDQDIRLEVDRQSRVAESVEGNNLFFDAVYTGYPDLSIACITWAPHPDNGSMLTVFAEVQNTGTGSTGRPFQFAHSADAGDAESLTIYGLPANSSTIVSWKWSLRPGEHVFTAVADISDAVMEPNENDDRLMVDYPSGKPRPTPQFLNLLLDNVTYRQSGNRTGDKNQNILTLIISVQNTGQQDLPESFAAIIADSLLVAVLPVPRLAVNATAVIAYPWNASTDNHTVKVVVDHQRQFPEDIETDNWISIFIEGNNPPLAYAGGNYSVTAGSPVTLKGFAQDAIDGYIALYEWDLNGDGTYEYNSTVSPVVTHVYYKKGTYTARLRVTDDRGATSTSSALVVVKLKEERPLLRMDELTYAAIILSLAVLAAAAVMIYRKRDEW